MAWPCLVRPTFISGLCSLWALESSKDGRDFNDYEAAAADSDGDQNDTNHLFHFGFFVLKVNGPRP